MGSFADPDVSDQLKTILKTYIDEEGPVDPDSLYSHPFDQEYSETEIRHALRALADKGIITHTRDRKLRASDTAAGSRSNASP